MDSIKYEQRSIKFEYRRIYTDNQKISQTNGTTIFKSKSRIKSNFFSTKFQKFLFIQEDQLGVSLLTYEQIKDENNQKKILSRVEINVDI